MDQNGTSTGAGAGTGAGQAAPCSLSVFVAGPGPEAPEEFPQPSGAGCRDGFTGALALQSVESFTEEETGAVLSRLNHLSRWVQAQQAKVLSRMQTIYREEILFASALLDPDMAFSLAAEEAAAILGVPTGTGMALMSQAGDLCTANTATLGSLEAGKISYGHAETVLEQCVGIAAADVPSFEAKLLGLAAGQTKNQFRVKARRLRESQYPETIIQRQRTAFERRSVWVRHEPDGMSCLSGMLPADTAQGIYNQLSVAARGEQAAGDSRTVDQLRADILAELLVGPHHDCNDHGSGTDSGGRKDGGGSGTDSAGRKGGGGGNGSRGDESGSHKAAPGKAGLDEAAAENDGTGTGSGRRRTNHGSRARARARTEILVLITAETLFGADDQPAELLGYGPISPEAARRMAREAARWTPVERDPATEEVLRVGKRRKVPDGLKRFLRARDGTCRFPGCRTNAVISEIDHTKPWTQGGPTDHDNLEHLCRRHHMFKTKGFWKACQPTPGIIEWTSPGGRKYRTEPHLTLTQGGDAQTITGAQTAPISTAAPLSTGAPIITDSPIITGASITPGAQPGQSAGDWASAEPSGVDSTGPGDEDDYGSDPPPF